jgi:hypothetical protein
LASALEKLLADDLLRSGLGKAAQETARTRFNATVVAKSMLGVYYQLMDRADFEEPEVSLKGEGSR